MDSVTQKARLEKALRIALLRAHGGNEKYARFLVDNLAYREWQDIGRLISQLEALEAASGVQHVRVKVPSAYRTGEFYV